MAQPGGIAKPCRSNRCRSTLYRLLGGPPTPADWSPGSHRLDWSIFKSFYPAERTPVEFRAEFLNRTNHPEFAQPGSLNFTGTKNFAKITATRDNPNDPREIQFALKLYFNGSDLAGTRLNELFPNHPTEGKDKLEPRPIYDMLYSLR